MASPSRSGVFDSGSDSRVEQFCESISFDSRLYKEDIRGSIAHARMLADQNLISQDEDPEIFAKYLHGLGNMTDEELQLYLEYFDRLNQGIRQPDKIIYLQCHDVDTLMGRISKRGRKEESDIPPAFLSGLNGYYQAFPAVVKSKYGIEVMTFDVTHFDVHDPKQADAFLALAEAFLEEEPKEGRAKTRKATKTVKQQVRVTAN